MNLNALKLLLQMYLALTPFPLWEFTLRRSVSGDPAKVKSLFLQGVGLMISGTIQPHFEGVCLPVPFEKHLWVPGDWFAAIPLCLSYFLLTCFSLSFDIIPFLSSACSAVVCLVRNRLVWKLSLPNLLAIWLKDKGSAPLEKIAIHETKIVSVWKSDHHGWFSVTKWKAMGLDENHYFYKAC